MEYIILIRVFTSLPFHHKEETQNKNSHTTRNASNLLSIPFFCVSLVILKGPTDSEKALGTDIIMPCYAPTAVNVTWWKDNVLVNIDQESRFEVKYKLFFSNTKYVKLKQYANVQLYPSTLNLFIKKSELVEIF